MIWGKQSLSFTLVLMLPMHVDYISHTVSFKCNCVYLKIEKCVYACQSILHEDKNTVSKCRHQSIHANRGSSKLIQA